MLVNVLNLDGQPTGRQIELPDNVFGVEPNEHAVYLDVKQYLANQRQGTHKSKNRNEVSGSTRKLKRQKGTGTARAGSNKSPVFVRGGDIFGPRPRDYRFSLNKKLKRLARRSALSSKAGKNEIIVVENFNLDSPRTSGYKEMLQKLNLTAVKTLFVTGEYDSNIYLSARNLPKAKVRAAKDLCTYDILNSRTLIVPESALGKVVEICSK